MERRVLVEISRGGALYAMLRDEQPKSLMKLVFLGVNVPDSHDRRPPESVDKEKVQIRLNTDRLLDRWLHNRWLSWCSINKKEMRFNAWITMQIHKGWNVIESDERIFVPHYGVMQEPKNSPDALMDDGDFDDAPYLDFDQALASSYLASEVDDPLVDMDIALGYPPASSSPPEQGVKHDVRLGVRPEFSNLKIFKQTET